MTNAQAFARARGLWGTSAYVERPQKEQAQVMARAALCSWLDGLTLVVRSLDLLRINAEHPDDSSTVGTAARHLQYPPSFAPRGGPFKIGAKSPYRFFTGFSWEECFEKAEKEPPA